MKRSERLAAKAMMLTEYILNGLNITPEEIYITDKDVEDAFIQQIAKAIDDKRDGILYGIMKEHDTLPFAHKITIEIEGGQLYVRQGLTKLEDF